MTLEQRVAKLERQNRWMRRAGAVLLAGVACVVLVGQGKPKKLPDLEVRSLALKDTDGRVRARLALDDGAPTLSFHDKASNRRMLLRVLADYGPALILYDKAASPRLVIRSLADGRPSIILSDKALTTIWHAPP